MEITCKLGFYIIWKAQCMCRKMHLLSAESWTNYGAKIIVRFSILVNISE